MHKCFSCTKRVPNFGRECLLITLSPNIDPVPLEVRTSNPSWALFEPVEKMMINRLIGFLIHVTLNQVVKISQYPEFRQMSLYISYYITFQKLILHTLHLQIHFGELL